MIHDEQNIKILNEGVLIKSDFVLSVKDVIFFVVEVPFSSVSEKAGSQ